TIEALKPSSYKPMECSDHSDDISNPYVVTCSVPLKLSYEHPQRFSFDCMSDAVCKKAVEGMSRASTAKGKPYTVVEFTLQPDESLPELGLELRRGTVGGQAVEVGVSRGFMGEQEVVTMVNDGEVVYGTVHSLFGPREGVWRDPGG